MVEPWLETLEGQERTACVRGLLLTPYAGWLQVPIFDILKKFNGEIVHEDIKAGVVRALTLDSRHNSGAECLPRGRGPGIRVVIASLVKLRVEVCLA